MAVVATSSRVVAMPVVATAVATKQLPWPANVPC